MQVQYPLNEKTRARILAKCEKAMQRRTRIKKRKGAEVEIANAWCAIWMAALGVRPFEPEVRKN